MPIGDIATALLNAISGFSTGYADTKSGLIQQKHLEEREDTKEAQAKAERERDRAEKLEAQRRQEEIEQGRTAQAGTQFRLRTEQEQANEDRAYQLNLLRYQGDLAEAQSRGRQLEEDLNASRNMLQIQNALHDLELTQKELQLKGSKLTPNSPEAIAAANTEAAGKLMAKGLETALTNYDILTDSNAYTKAISEAVKIPINTYGETGSDYLDQQFKVGRYRVIKPQNPPAGADSTIGVNTVDSTSTGGYQSEGIYNEGMKTWAAIGKALVNIIGSAPETGSLITNPQYMKSQGYKGKKGTEKSGVTTHKTLK